MILLMAQATSQQAYLVGCNRKHWEVYVLTEFYFLLNGLVEDFGWQYMDAEYEDPPEFGTINSKILELNISALLFCETTITLYHHLPISTLRNRGVVIANFGDDTHMYNRWSAADMRYYLENTDVIVSTYAYLMRTFCSTVMDVNSAYFPSIFWSPHSASHDFSDRPYNKNPMRKIFLSGAAGKRAYPIRHWLYKQAESEQYKDMFHIHQHPGYGKVDKNQTLLYAMDMNSYVAGISTTMYYRWMVAKTFEVPSTGSLLVVNLDLKEQLEELGFVHMENYVGFPNDNPMPTLKWVLDPENVQEIEQIRKKGRKLVMERHLTKHRVKALHERLVLGKDHFQVVQPNRTSPCPIMEHLELKTCVQAFQYEFETHCNENDRNAGKIVRYNSRGAPETHQIKAPFKKVEISTRSKKIIAGVLGIMSLLFVITYIFVIHKKTLIRPKALPYEAVSITEA